MIDAQVEKAFAAAKERYGEVGVDVDASLKALKAVAISLHCWQGDDVRGFEQAAGPLSSGGLQVTGQHPGRARTIEELRQDLAKAFSLIPGRHRLNLHAIYGDFGGKPVDRDAVEPAHFKSWVVWSREKKLNLDFNATCFAHPRADSGYTLSSPDKDTRKFWIEHVKRCRKIASFLGRELKSMSLHNLWIPDGSKDAPVDRWSPRSRLKESLDEIFQVEYSPTTMKDSLESKLFGLGSESYVVGSHEFYLGYALARRKLICLDLGHFHPTESVADKLSALLCFGDEILLHLSRPVRWDSDHVVILNDELRAVAEEIVRGRALDKVRLATDFFDASLNRVGAWVIGARATLKAVLLALLQPADRLLEMEKNGDYFGRLAVLEEVKSLPGGAVWDYYCLSLGVPPGLEWLPEITAYERAVLSRRRP
jgi:L-rhamnose isomerase